jgi:hypothetical protein
MSQITGGLKLKILSGERFKIGQVYATVTKIKSPTDFVISLERSLIETFEIGQAHAVEVMPGVRIQAGHGGTRDRCTVIIEAPSHVRIERLTHSDERFA